MSKKVLRNGQITLNNEKKKRSAEDKNILKKNAEKKFKKEKEIKETKIDWEEEKDIIEKYLSQEYPLMNSKKIGKIIQEKANKYIDFDKYKSFFLRYQSNKATENVKKLSSSVSGKQIKHNRSNDMIKISKKLSDAPESIKDFFDDEAKESKHNSSDEEDEFDTNEDDNSQTETDTDEEEDDESNPPKLEDDKSIDMEGEKEDDKNIRKRKCEYSNLDDSKSKKKDALHVRWLPDGNKVGNSLKLTLY